MNVLKPQCTNCLDKASLFNHSKTRYADIIASTNPPSQASQMRNSDLPLVARSVRAQILVLRDTTVELAAGVDLIRARLNEMRRARDAFESLAMNDSTADSDTYSASDLLICASRNGVALMVSGSEAQQLANSITGLAADNLKILERDIQKLTLAVSVNSDLTEVAAALHEEASNVASTCAGWVRLTASMARQLVGECELMHHRISEQAQCRQLVLTTLRQAKSETLGQASL